MTTLAFPWQDTLDGLPLISKTNPSWFAQASGAIGELLNDHAHCELKAASTALRLVGRYADDPALVQRMLALSYEELGHFRQVCDFLKECGGTLTPPRPDRYVRALRDWSFREPGGVGSKADACLAAAFVEARSCERFRVLAEGFSEDSVPNLDPDFASKLNKFYLNLADAESRHWETFRDLTLEAGEIGAVERRLHHMAEAEAEILAGLSLEPRMH